MPWTLPALPSPKPNPTSRHRRKTAQRRLRRLFLEPLEDRRLLTYGWGSTSATGSLPGYDWGPSYAYVEWLESDTDDDGIPDSAASISLSVLEDEGAAEGGQTKGTFYFSVDSPASAAILRTCHEPHALL